jgi:hypothetical protein
MIMTGMIIPGGLVAASVVFRVIGAIVKRCGVAMITVCGTGRRRMMIERCAEEAAGRSESLQRQPDHQDDQQEETETAHRLNIPSHVTDGPVGAYSGSSFL